MIVDEFAASIRTWTDCEITAYQLGIHMGAFDQEDVSVEDFYNGDFDDNEYILDVKAALLNVLFEFEKERFIVYYSGESSYKWRYDTCPM